MLGVYHPHQHRDAGFDRASLEDRKVSSVRCFLCFSDKYLFASLRSTSSPCFSKRRKDDFVSLHTVCFAEPLRKRKDCERGVFENKYQLPIRYGWKFKTK